MRETLRPKWLKRFGAFDSVGSSVRNSGSRFGLGLRRAVVDGRCQSVVKPRCLPFLGGQQCGVRAALIRIGELPRLQLADGRNQREG